MPSGLNLNFYVPVLKDGIKRMVLSRQNLLCVFAPLRFNLAASEQIRRPRGKP